jgi:hypothetical protein
MQWWNEFLTWLNSIEGRRVVTTAILPFLAILVSGVVAALIARSFSKRVLAFQDREMKASAITALIGAGRKATSWSSLGGEEKQRVDNQLNEADIRVRLLPMTGASAAADWAAHELAAMKKNSANYSFQAEQTFVDYRNRLLEWQNKPKRARKLFAFDLEQWRTDEESAAKTVAEKQQQRAAKPATEGAAATAVSPLATATAAPVAVPAPETEAAPRTERPFDRETEETSGRRPFGYAPEDSAADKPTDAAPEDTQTADDTDEDTVTAVHDVYSPPVNAGTVRQRTDPDPTFGDQISR